MQQDGDKIAGDSAAKPSWFAKIVHILGWRILPRDSAALPGGEFAANPTLPEQEELEAYCRGLMNENAQMRTALDDRASKSTGRLRVTKAEQTTTTPVDWHEAYWSLHAEMQSLQRDNDALLSEIRGRKRSQYGSRSERVLPEELLAAVRKLTLTDPEHVPAGILEELEQVCAEREMRRQKRKKRQQDKRQDVVNLAARRMMVATEDDEDPDGGDDDNGGGGKQPQAETDADPCTPVIPLRRVGHGHGRNACLAGLPPLDTVLPVTGEGRQCPECHKERKLIGYQNSHLLDLTLPSLRHLHFRQEKRACAQHPDAGVAVAPAVERPLAQALPTALLLAYLVVAKVADHLPLERQSSIFERWGCRLPPSTLGGWFAAAGELVSPLAEHLGKFVLTSDQCLHTDGTYVRVIDPSAPRGSTHGGLWGYTVPSVGTYFRYTEDGTYGDTRASLSARIGPTMTDGHKGYVSQRVADSPQALPVIHGTHLNCMAHARRPFEEAFRLDGDLRAGFVLHRIQSLYRIEATAKAERLEPEQIKALREAQSRPIFNKLIEDVQALQPWVTPKSRLGRAMATLLGRRMHLEAYLSHGAWPIDNNLQESQFRSKAIGQHNWLFIGSHDAAPRYAALLTLVRTCLLLDIDPVAYLADVFMQLQKRGSAKRIDDLLPANWKARNSVKSQSAIAA